MKIITTHKQAEKRRNKQNKKPNNQNKNLYFQQ